MASQEVQVREKMRSEAEDRYHMAMAHILDEIEEYEVTRLHHLRDSLATYVELHQGVSSSTSRELSKLERTVALCSPEVDFQEFLDSHSLPTPSDSVSDPVSPVLFPENPSPPPPLPDFPLSLYPSDAHFYSSLLPEPTKSDLAIVFFTTLVLSRPGQNWSLGQEDELTPIIAHIRAKLKVNSKLMQLIVTIFGREKGNSLQNRLFRLKSGSGGEGNLIKAEIVHGWSLLSWYIKKSHNYASLGADSYPKPEEIPASSALTAASLEALLREIEGKEGVLYTDFPTNVVYSRPMVESLFVYVFPLKLPN